MTTPRGRPCLRHHLGGAPISLILESVTKRVGAELHLHDINLELQPEGFNVLLGATRSGKTSLIQLMAGLERPTSGAIHYNGRDVTRVPTRQRNVSMVHQQFINYPHFTVFENIASPLRVAGRPRAEIRDRVESVAALLKLSEHLPKYPNELSGGQQQRTALARALIKDADIIFLDEPLANLDYKLREEIHEELPKLFRDRGCTAVYATSEPTEALLLGGHVATLKAGRVTQFGATAEVYRRPANLDTAITFSDPPINLAAGRKHGDRFQLTDAIGWPIPGPARALADGRYVAAVRPHHVVLGEHDAEGMAPLRGTVQVTEISGSESTVHFRFGDFVWVSQSHGIHPLAVGAAATFHLASKHCLYFDAASGAFAHGQVDAPAAHHGEA